jgi:hypothetical protein
LPDDDLQDDDTTEPQTESDDIRQLRKKAKKADALEAELTTLKREKEFTRAGLDPDNAQHRYFMRGYDGDLSAEAIKAEAQSAGFLEAPATQVPAEEQETQARISAASAGAAVQPEKDWDAELRGARTEAEFDSIYRQSGRAMK